MPPASNISMEERKALTSLSNDNTFIILPSGRVCRAYFTVVPKPRMGHGRPSTGQASGRAGPNGGRDGGHVYVRDLTCRRRRSKHTRVLLSLRSACRPDWCSGSPSYLMNRPICCFCTYAGLAHNTKPKFTSFFNPL